MNNNKVDWLIGEVRRLTEIVARQNACLLSNRAITDEEWADMIKILEPKEIRKHGNGD